MSMRKEPPLTRSLWPISRLPQKSVVLSPEVSPRESPTVALPPELQLDESPLPVTRSETSSRPPNGPATKMFSPRRLRLPEKSKTSKTRSPSMKRPLMAMFAFIKTRLSKEVSTPVDGKGLPIEIEVFASRVSDEQREHSSTSSLNGSNHGEYSSRRSRTPFLWCFLLRIKQTRVF